MVHLLNPFIITNKLSNKAAIFIPMKELFLTTSYQKQKYNKSIRETDYYYNLSE